MEYRLKLRKIAYQLPRAIYYLAEQRYFDTLTMHNIAIKRIKHGRQTIPVMIAYDKKRGTVEIVTIHPISEEQIKARIESRRWIKNA